MKNVREFLKTHSRNVWSVSPELTAFAALELMAAKDIGTVLVIDNCKLVGIFSERDYARKVILQGKSSKDTCVSEVMTQQVFYVNPGNTMAECMALISAKKIRCLPVIDSDLVVGIITIGDVVNEIISDQEVTIRTLETCITERYG